MQKKILIAILIIAGTINLICAQTNSKLIFKEENIPTAPNLRWPVDKPAGLQNFAQELILNKERLQDYLLLARAYYIKGYNNMEVYLGEEKFRMFKQIAGIKMYEKNPEGIDPYDIDPYKFEIFTPTGFSVLRDFNEALYSFTEAYNILRYIGAWDVTITTKELYKKLIDNLYRSLIYCCVHVNNYEKALKYVNEFKKISDDEKFIIEWETRIYGVLVGIAKKYDWSFTGDKSYRKRKEHHRKLLLKAIELYYPGESYLKNVLKKKIYPEFIYEPPSVTNNQAGTNK